VVRPIRRAPQSLTLLLRAALPGQCGSTTEDVVRLYLFLTPLVSLLGRDMVPHFLLQFRTVPSLATPPQLTVGVRRRRSYGPEVLPLVSALLFYLSYLFAVLRVPCNPVSSPNSLYATPRPERMTGVTYFSPEPTSAVAIFLMPLCSPVS